MVSIACLAVSADGRVGNPDYAGGMKRGEGRVVMRIVEENGKPRAIRFQAYDVLVRCESADRRRRITEGARTMALQAGRRFHGEFHGLLSYEEFFAIKGRLRGGGRASGTFLYYLNRHDGAGETDVFDSECSTAGEVRWKATKVDRR